MLSDRLKQVGKFTAEILAQVVLVGLCVALLLVALRRLTPARGSELRAAAPIEFAQSWLSGLHKLKIRDAVETYFWETGNLPTQLVDLSREGYLGPSEAAFPWGEPYLYETYQDGPEKGYFLFEPLR